MVLIHMGEIRDEGGNHPIAPPLPVALRAMKRIRDAVSRRLIRNELPNQNQHGFASTTNPILVLEDLAH